MPDEHLKLLNLGSDWLTSLLPHCLSRTSRVHYGLLQPEELRHALEECPGMARNRRYLAVPFVGKDVPSRASEFSHPDVVIGLTILAYRYEGLRRSDLTSKLRALREQLSLESGPHHKRPAALVFVGWVTEAPYRPSLPLCSLQPSPSLEAAPMPLHRSLQLGGGCEARAVKERWTWRASRQ